MSWQGHLGPNFTHKGELIMENVIVFAVVSMVASFFLLIRHWLKNA
jgi:hypothetical protein